MNDRSRTRAAVVRPLILALTALGIWMSLWIGQQSRTLNITVGDPAPETFVTEFGLDPIEDKEATQRLRDAAADSVPDVYVIDETVDDVVIDQIREVFADARELAVDPGQPTVAEIVEPVPTTTIPSDPEPTTTTSTDPPTVDGDTAAGDPTEPSTTTTTAPARTSDVMGVLYIDNDGDGIYIDANDFEVPEVEVVVIDSLGDQFRARTSTRGTFVVRDLPPGPAQIIVDPASVPETLTSSDPKSLTVEIDLAPNDIVELRPIGFVPRVKSAEELAVELKTRHGSLSDAQVALIADFATSDVVREAAGQATWLDIMELAAIERAQQALNRPGGIRPDQLEDVKDELRRQISFVPLPGGSSDSFVTASLVASEVAAEFLLPNSRVDEALTEQARQAARQAVEPVLVVFGAGDTIVEQGELITQVQFEALEQAGFFQPAQIELYALAAIVALIVTALSVYIARFRPLVWNNMRKLALFGLLLVMSAVAARAIAVFASDNPEIGYLMPAAAIGLMAAILFDARIAVLMSVAVGAITAVATGDPGFTLFALIATLAPVPWVSSISARGELRSAVIYTTISLAVAAGVIAWFFHGERFALAAAGYGAVNGILSGLVGTAALSFLEIAFDLTTSLRLLDLTDRNHPALRLLEDEAIGTFNHSLMVGTLADKAARAVGANNLLARAAAYYHDLGKTKNPQYFIENQFGHSNPHDLLPPEESASIIRQHVIDGSELAAEYRIPSDVVEGVVSHHGDGVMRYFYNKAVERYGAENVKIDDYRHAGHKPRSKEMAIVMMADAVEGASRAIFEKEDPSPERIAEVVEQVVGEKVADGQLSESDLTLGDLTKAKAAMIEALKGYYHQRIPYPNFPDTPAPQPRPVSAPIDGHGGSVERMPSAETAPAEEPSTTE